MRRVTWLVLIGAACVGCGKKEEVAVPNVELDTSGQGVAVPFQVKQPPTFELSYGKMWDPKGAENADPRVAVKAFFAKQHFAAHQTEFLAPATVGSFVSLAQGGMHGVATPVALAAVYPDVGRTFEAEMKKGLKITATNVGTPLLDVSASGGAVATRVLVIRVTDGADDELRIRFGEYLARVEDAVKGTGATVTVHQRGGIRILGALSDIRYDTAGHTGFVRSVVVRKSDDADAEFSRMILEDTAKGENVQFFKSVMTAEQGPFLIVALRDERR